MYISAYVYSTITVRSYTSRHSLITQENYIQNRARTSFENLNSGPISCSIPHCSSLKALYMALQTRYSASKPVKTFNLPPRQLSKVMTAKEVPFINSLLVPIHSPTNHSSRPVKECQPVNLLAKKLILTLTSDGTLNISRCEYVATRQINPEAS